MSGDLKLELKSFRARHLIDVSISNIGSEPIVAFVQELSWCLELVPEHGPWEYPPPTKQTIIIDDPVIADWFWQTIEPGESVGDIYDLAQFIDNVLDVDGWYLCTLVYDDNKVKGLGESYEVEAESEIGKVSFPQIEVHVVDGTAVEWRPLDDD
ncbi:MAG: hypothetical protein IH945_09420 [Armatimonadetes bacterium]|nr:hypothetical protein [Armatimonadota bacterium]